MLLQQSVPADCMQYVTEYYDSVLWARPYLTTELKINCQSSALCTMCYGSQLNYTWGQFF